MRVAVALGLLCAAVAADAKPVDEPVSASPARYMMEAGRACIAAHPPDVARDPQDAYVAQHCQCAVERFMAGRGTSELPSLRDSVKPIEEAYAACRAEGAGEIASTASAEATRTDAGSKDPDAPASPGIWSRLSGIDPVGWFNRSELPTWAWAAIAGFGLLLVMALRGRRPRGDLIAPPRSMRPSSNPQRGSGDRTP